MTQVIYDHDRAAIVHGRALESMRALLADKSVDMVLTDPPYSDHVHAKLGKERRNDGRVAREALEFPPLTLDDIAQLAAEYVRACRGWIVIFSDFYLSAEWGRALERAGGAWVRTGQWVKTNPMPQMTGDRPACGAEDIVIGHGSPDTLEGRRAWDWNGGGHAATWRGPRQHGAEHPNQKPEWLIQALLGSFAPAGGLVLDPFLGSGTTVAAALAPERVLGENAIDTACPKCSSKRAAEWAPPLPQDVRVLGIEGDRRWVDHAIARIAPALGALKAA